MRGLIPMTMLAIACTTIGAVMATRSTSAQSQCLAITSDGAVQGLDHGASCSFLGIPFAAPPVAGLRWKAPQPASPWAPNLLVARTATSCAQLNAVTGATMGSEDCLQLNVWTPNPLPPSGAPVIVWLHPGAFANASANFAPQNGEALAASTGAVIVAPNYRLGPFGFLAHSALADERGAVGNYGLLDQRAALVWVRDHIAAFGGDPNNVTLGGQSAGAHSVGLHLVAPGSQGVFQHAIMQSGYASFRWRSAADGQAQAAQFAAALGCTTADATELVTCLRGKNRDQVLLATPPPLFEQLSETGRTQWAPIVDGVEIPDQPRYLFEAGAFSHVPVILGANRDEGWTFVNRSFPSAVTLDQYSAAVESEFGADAAAVLAAYPGDGFVSPKDALAAVAGDAEYVCEARRMARLIESTGTPAFLYLFGHEVVPVAGNRVVHGLEVNFVFGNDYAPPLFPTYALGPADLDIAHAMAGYWTRFATTGNPNTDDPTVVHWPAIARPEGSGRGVDKYLGLQQPIQAGNRLSESRCDFWEPYFFRSISGAVPANAN
jgi:para-nitrobenzyl esterase